MILRRQFLALAAASAAPGPGIVDTHTHFYDPLRPQGVPWPPKSETLLYRTVLPAEFKALVQPLGVSGTIVVEASPWLEDNQWVLDLARQDPFLLGLVGRLDPAQPAFPQHLERFRRNPLFLGIRLGAGAIQAGLSQTPFMDHLRLLASAGLMLDALGGAAMLPAVARLAASIPGLRIVVDHMPFDDPGASLAAFSALPNVYCKVSSVLRRVDGKLITDLAHYRPALDALWDAFGARRLIYGSNWPVSERVGPYSEVLRIVREYFAAKGPQASALYFRENSQAAYRWRSR